MTAVLDPSAARRKSSRSSTAPRRKNSATRSSLRGTAKQSTRGEAKQGRAKVVPLRQTNPVSDPASDLTISAGKLRSIAPEANLRHLEQSSLGRATTRSPAKRSSVRSLPQPQPLPLWLRGLFALQQGSTLITLLLVIAGLGVYGWTVYTQQRWSDAYRQLERLQKRERQFLTTNEVLKNQMAEQAEKPGTGLVPPDPNSTIFLSPAPLRPATAPEVTPMPDTPIPARPLGY